MATFKQNHLKTSNDVLARQKAKPVIFVEGETDHLIFSEYWFADQLDKVEFTLAEHAQGCTAVLKAVAQERRSGVAAFGWVDRDKLLDQAGFGLLLETDDAKFDASQPWPHIKVARRWEIENYLMAPNMLAPILAALEHNGKSQPVDVMTAKLLNDAQVLIPFTAWNLALHNCGRKSLADGRSNPFPNRTAMENELGQYHDKEPEVWAEYQKILPRIEAFSGTSDSAEAVKLNGLLRIVNGKAMLLRIKHHMKAKVDLTFLLAKDLKSSIPEEIAAFVLECIHVGTIQ